MSVWFRSSFCRRWMSVVLRTRCHLFGWTLVMNLMMFNQISIHLIMMIKWFSSFPYNSSCCRPFPFWRPIAASLLWIVRKSAWKNYFLDCFTSIHLCLILFFQLASGYQLYVGILELVMLDYDVLVRALSTRATVTRLYSSLYSRSFDDLKSLQVCDDVIKLPCAKPTFARYTACTWRHGLRGIVAAGHGCFGLLLCLLWSTSSFFVDDTRDIRYLLPIFIQLSIQLLVFWLLHQLCSLCFSFLCPLRRLTDTGISKILSSFSVMLECLRALILDHHQLFNQPQEPLLERFMNIPLKRIPIGIISFVSSQISHDFELVSSALCRLLFQRLGIVGKLFVLNVELFDLGFQG